MHIGGLTLPLIRARGRGSKCSLSIDGDAVFIHTCPGLRKFVYVFPDHKQRFSTRAEFQEEGELDGLGPNNQSGTSKPPPRPWYRILPGHNTNSFS